MVHKNADKYIVQMTQHSTIWGKKDSRRHKELFGTAFLSEDMYRGSLNYNFLEACLIEMNIRSTPELSYGLDNFALCTCWIFQCLL